MSSLSCRIWLRERTKETLTRTKTKAKLVLKTKLIPPVMQTPLKRPTVRRPPLPTRTTVADLFPQSSQAPTRELVLLMPMTISSGMKRARMELREAGTSSTWRTYLAQLIRSKMTMKWLWSIWARWSTAAKFQSKKRLRGDLIRSIRVTLSS